MSSSEVITKRLHISGLTPQISEADLKTRFSSFGNVKGLDGLGNLDGLGQPKAYAYVTLETTKSQLSKCLNLLSGTTWKGAKLRIGEAKPDFRERIKRENELVNGPETRATKRRCLARGSQGVHSSVMSLVTQTSLRPGWRVTPLGRLVRPIRMRPLHPLPEQLPSDTQLVAAKARKKRTRKNGGVIVRARRRKIDPEDWGSSYLSGVMLEGGSGLVLPEKSIKAREKVQKLGSPTKHHEGSIDEGANQAIVSPELQSSSLSPPKSGAVQYANPVDVSTSPDLPRTIGHRPVAGSDLVQEKERTLAFLDSLFNSKADDEDWGTEESLSDIGAHVEQQQQPSDSIPTTTQLPHDDVIEYVPRMVPVRSSIQGMEEEKGAELSDESVQHQAHSDGLPEENIVPVPSQAIAQATKLKDMFAPRPEDAGFSILDNLDLELEEEMPPISAPLPIPPLSDPDVLQSILTTSRNAKQTTFSFDPKLRFFFPHSLNPRSSLIIKPGDPRDIFSQPSHFFRTESDEEIRARWESRKVELTRDWKRRHREAVKSARRRGTGAHD